MSPSRHRGAPAGGPPSLRPTGHSGPTGPVLVAVLAALVPACIPKPQMPEGVDPPPAPFERAPYVQAVGDDRALVMWRTADPEAPSRLRYRVDDGAWSPADVRRGEGGDRAATLRNLPPASSVTYTVEADGLEMGPFRVRTAPRDTAGAPLDVLAFGDSGWGSAAQADLADRMGERPWALAVHVGDIAYPDGREEDFTLRHFRMYGPLLSRVPLFPSPGNHDVREAGGGGAAYDRAFAWPGEERGGRHYTFRWGRAQFLALDTSTDSAMAELERREGEQYRWLADTLAAMARDTTLAWRVVFTHRPLYSRAAGFGRNPPTDRLRSALEPLFLEHGVDLYLGGHDHHYQRSLPLRDGRAVKPGCGPVYVVTGGGGASRFARSVAPGPLTARVSRAYHFLALTLGPGEGSGEAIGRDGEVVDRFRLSRYEPDGSTCGAGRG